VSLPHLLLVDDSEAVLAFERAALSGHYALSTATNGREALQKIEALKPSAVLLDLSMPQMDGDEVLAQMQRDEVLRRIPVIIVSSERQRAEECLRGGAKAFLPKPIRAKELLPLVSRVLDDARQEERRGNLAALFVGVGPIELGIPLDSVETVLHQMATRPLPLAPNYLRELVEIHGQPVCVLDLARRLGVTHASPIDERKLVVVSHQGLRLAICVDFVRDPVELPASELTHAEHVGGAEHGLLREALVAVAATSRGPLPIVEPLTLLSRHLLRELPELLRSAEIAAAGAPEAGP
jgi:CheY-like chemotaxis protein